MEGKVLPRVIYSLWLQGRANAPELVEFNFKRWEKINPSYELKVLDGDDVSSLFTGLAIEGISHQALSDLVRLKLLSNGGGIWADASVLPVVPLDAWIGEAVEAMGFFAFERQDVPLSSWFLAARPGNEIVQTWWEAAASLWSVPRSTHKEPILPDNPGDQVDPSRIKPDTILPYFWVHCLFAYLLQSNHHMAHLWIQRQRRPASEPHRLQDLFRTTGKHSDRDVWQVIHSAPVQKLDWRKAYPLDRLERLIDGPEPKRGLVATLLGFPR